MTWEQDLLLIIPAVCAGVLFIGLTMFAYLSIFSRSGLYTATTVLTAVGFVFTASELLIVLFGSTMGNFALGVQFHRLEQLAGAYFIAAVPFLLVHLLELGTRFHAINRGVLIFALAFSLVATVVAFARPDLFVSVTTRDPDWQSIWGDLGRGAVGIVYTMRDLVLAPVSLYAVTAIVVDLARSMRFSALGPVLFGLLAALYFAADDIIHIYTGIHIGPFPSVEYSRTPVGITIFITFSMLTVFKRFIDQSREMEATNAILTWSQERLEDTNRRLARFVPSEFIAALGKRDINDVDFGDHVQQTMTILFADIRAFTEISERLTPDETFRFVNSYLSHVAPPIRRHGGFVDKFIGDAIMAVFPERADDAVQAAIEMHRSLVDFNESWAADGHEPVRIGIGIHTGEVMLGTVGNAERMDGTVISDAVNLCSRIESITKHFGLRIALSERTFVELADASAYHFRFMGKVRVKGKHASVSVFEILDGESDEAVDRKRRAQVHFEQGITTFFQRRLTESAGHFDEVLAITPDDAAARVYRRRIGELLLEDEASAAPTTPDDEEPRVGPDERDDPVSL